jgi:hypothetical protein
MFGSVGAFLGIQKMNDHKTLVTIFFAERVRLILEQ